MNRHKKCRVVYGREHLATVWYLDDGRWSLELVGTAQVPFELLGYSYLFDAYVGTNPPPLIREFIKDRSIQLSPTDPIGTLLTQTGTQENAIRFVP